MIGEVLKRGARINRDPDGIVQPNGGWSGFLEGWRTSLQLEVAAKAILRLSLRTLPTSNQSESAQPPVAARCRLTGCRRTGTSSEHGPTWTPGDDGVRRIP